MGMKMKLFLLLLPSLSLAELKPNMIGKFQLETSEGFTAYMTELGVNVFTRLIACSLYPIATNSQRDNVITIHTSSTFKSSTVSFELGKPFEETTADGREVLTTATLEGNVLTKQQVRMVKGMFIESTFVDSPNPRFCLKLKCSQF